MNRQFSDIFNASLNAVNNISNDDIPPMPEKQYTAEEMAIIAEHYLVEIEKDTEAAQADPFQVGMLVFCQSFKGAYYGRIIKRLGWSEFWRQNKYDVSDVFGNVRWGIFEQDIERVTLTGAELFMALKAGEIKGGRA